MPTRLLEIMSCIERWLGEIVQYFASLQQLNTLAETRGFPDLGATTKRSKKRGEPRGDILFLPVCLRAQIPKYSTSGCFVSREPNRDIIIEASIESIDEPIDSMQ